VLSSTAKTLEKCDNSSQINSMITFSEEALAVAVAVVPQGWM
jgi:hypothetical protein